MKFAPYLIGFLMVAVLGYGVQGFFDNGGTRGGQPPGARRADRR